MTKPIERLLIANRGEIACRVMRTAQDMGLETVAIYSDADEDSPHVKLADSAVHIGPSPVSDSYLVTEKIIAAAVRSGANAIHPGYGFLSENAEFARACNEAGIIFVGPSERAIAVMGDKARAKRAMIEADVPCVPGYQGEDQTDEILITEAAKIGFPVMVKAAAGGGGRGMRLVRQAGELESSLKLARSEAENAFGSGELIIEKAIIRPRHVEIQVFGDRLGTIIHLGERDCSVQRRHQKVIEEAPCPVMTPALRAAMGEAAVAAARAVDYVGAGTVEFLLAEDGAFYFLEMNTRLQVEHPVTEQVTGLDLVELQLKVAAGGGLGLSQEDVTLSGHAIEVRLYAEDPQNDFLPSTGKVDHWHPPTGKGIRLDAGIESGGEISPFYDPMIAKVIATGKDREDARRRLVKALESSALVGPATNRDFLIDALKREAFGKGGATTAFIDEEYGDVGFHVAPDLNDLCLAAVIQYKLRRDAALAESLGVNPELLDWSSTGRIDSVFVYSFGGELISLTVTPQSPETYCVVAAGTSLTISIHRFEDRMITLKTDDSLRSVVFFSSNDDHTLTVASSDLQFTVRDQAAGESESELGGDGVIVAPMHGLLHEIQVEQGNKVEKGQLLAVLEAMKMQHEIVADIEGMIVSIQAKAGDQIAAGDIILEIESSK